MRKPRWLIVLFVLVYVGMLVGGAALKPGYSAQAQYISELGASGSAHAIVISVAGFIPVGVLAAALLVVMAPRVPVSGASRVGYWLLLCEPLAWIGSALAPCDLGCPMEGSLSQALHNLLGVFTYLGTTLGLVLLATTPGLRASMRMAWVALAATWLLLFVLMGAPPLHEWRGLLQRLAEWLVYGSLCITAWRLAQPAPSPGRD
ncbi:DUF998 domain-containing protein [Stenotrophomonas sp. SY1]|uniref:DUF998 domain-containing protein n=1 Tax=Stenotrophomonas sp. SY1 TaxID=477235 RepID=UPI001E41277F|nr:DUF998 domain-containing protein [Stenotrophomonas sp. SY1]MCD9088403.1 DUF998 domain-containing protein [Stenotrophomonas sp. SY1]